MDYGQHTQRHRAVNHISAALTLPRMDAALFAVPSSPSASRLGKSACNLGTRSRARARRQSQQSAGAQGAEHHSWKTPAKPRCNPRRFTTISPTGSTARNLPTNRAPHERYSIVLKKFLASLGQKADRPLGALTLIWKISATFQWTRESTQDS